MFCIAKSTYIWCKKLIKTIMKSVYKVEEFNNGTLFAVVMSLFDGSTEICSSYYKSKKAAEKIAAKCRFWAGETETVEFSF